MLFSASKGFCQWIETQGPASNVTRVLTVSGHSIFAGTDDGMFLSVDNGSAWTAMSVGLPQDAILSCAATDSSVYSGTLHSGIFRSRNRGVSWFAASNGFPKDSLDTNSYFPVNGFAKNGPALLACTVRKGVFLTANSGDLWTPINSGLTNTNVFAMVSQGNNVFSGTGAGGGVFLSGNNGNTWSAANNGLWYIVKMVYSVLTLAQNDNGVFAGTTFGGVYASSNNGASWSAINNGLIANTVLSLIAYGNILIAGTDFSGVFVSANNGATWTACNGGLPDNRAVLCLCVSDSSLFAGIYGSGVWRLPMSSLVGAPTAAVERKTAEVKDYIVTSASGILRYTLPIASNVSVRYYSLEGRLVASFVNHDQAAGNYSLALPQFAHGFYIRDFRAGSFTQKDRVRIPG
jgi:ligand-binding sensor domain-containing protein